MQYISVSPSTPRQEIIVTPNELNSSLPMTTSQNTSTGYMYSSPALLLGANYPEPEGTRVEFKSVFNDNLTPVYKRTINAFMNSEGGVLIFGISDNGIITGIKLDFKIIDKCKLLVDSLYQRETYPSFPGDLVVRTITLTATLGLIICEVKLNDTSEKATYYLSNSKAFKRMNASNVQCNYCPLVEQKQLIQAKQKHNELFQQVEKLKTELQKETEKIVDLRLVVEQQTREITQLKQDKVEQEKIFISLLTAERNFYLKSTR